MRMLKRAGLVFSGSDADLIPILQKTPNKYIWRIPAEEITRVHASNHFFLVVEELSRKTTDEQRILSKKLDQGRDSLHAGSLSGEAALISAGGAIETCKNVVSGRVKTGWGLVSGPAAVALLTLHRALPSTGGSGRDSDTDAYKKGQPADPSDSPKDATHPGTSPGSGDDNVKIDQHHETHTAANDDDDWDSLYTDTDAFEQGTQDDDAQWAKDDDHWTSYDTDTDAYEEGLACTQDEL
ncbi:hypothetical protein QBC39DRAFT_419158 [Podospora conica]|nr:hypothetical protein QBC39DRAFT_419158 [Schizothecium conicum]